MPALDDVRSKVSLSPVATSRHGMKLGEVDDGTTGSWRAAAWHVDITRSLGAVIVTVEGPLDARTAAALGDTLSDLIDGQGNLFLVVDVRAMVVTDVLALAVLTAARHSMEAREGRFLLAGALPVTALALRSGGLGAVIERHPERRHHPSAQ